MTDPRRDDLLDVVQANLDEKFRHPDERDRDHFAYEAAFALCRYIAESNRFPAGLVKSLAQKVVQ